MPRNALTQSCESQVNGSVYEHQVAIMNEAWDRWEVTNRGCLNDVFFGQTVSQIKCSSCEKFNQNFEFFNMISLPVPREDADIWTCLRMAFGDEHIHEWRCDHCGSKGISKKSQRIWGTSSILVIHLKRFSEDLSKIETGVRMPLSFKLGQYSLSLDDKYRLVSVACHVGSLNSGHYYAIRRNCKGEWCIYDDDRKYDITIDRMKNELLSNGYMFFYQRC
jgi:ubiquitin C-terminal hydrolase